MTSRARRNHAPTFKVTLAAVKADKTHAELSKQFDVHPNQIAEWENQLVRRSGAVFDGGPSKAETTADL